TLIDSEEEVLNEDTTSGKGIEFTGLVPFTSYTLSVSADNQFGSGPNASITAQTEEGIPLPPSQVAFPVTRSDWINVVWNAPSPPHGIIISYEIRYWKTWSGNQTSTVKITKQLGSQGQTKKISNLEGSHKYSVQVRAETSVGHGPWSDIATVTTDPGVDAVTQIPPITRQSSLLIIVICVVIAAAVVVVGVICYTRRRRKRRRRNTLQHPVVNAGQELVLYENTLPREEKPSALSQRHVSLVQESVYEPVGPGSSVRRDTRPAPPPEPQPTYEDVGLPIWANPWSVLWDDLMVGNKVLGKGHFGEVGDGVVRVKGDLCRAAIKKLKENATSADRQHFLEELKTMTLHGSHPNLFKILGACQHEGILYVAMEYLSNGDLRCYLRKARSMEDDGQASLSPQKLLQFALDVAKGMQHLAAHGVIHRDLAARNILLDDNLVAKVSDFGLSRGEDVYVQTSKTRVPTRWLSLESLTHQTYTSMSDVWSFGILLWEIATLGGTPYPGIKTQFLTYRLQNGYRMPKPGNSDAKIYNLMLKCWQDNPNDRPSFKKLVSVLKKMADSNADQIYIRLLPSSNKYLYENIHPEFDDN
ncbi:tyrosine-protein kinase receptor Tie-1-like, partial [Asterias rubens]|uniref:tyrosine-protein kinase receptor Tie-1-like n=1 Tax=Asterias rubens TaxID=7604 RepID=UPI0014554DC8